jgi:hypothetical protein
MNPRVKAVKAEDNFTLSLLFTNGERRLFDVKPYLTVGVFKTLDDPAYFRRVRVFLGSVEWPQGQDFCPDTLYEESVAPVRRRTFRPRPPRGRASPARQNFRGRHNKNADFIREVTP